MAQNRFVEIHVEDASLVGEVETRDDGSLLSDHLLMLFKQPVKVLIFTQGACKRLIRPKDGAFAEPRNGWHSATTTAVFVKAVSSVNDTLKRDHEGSNVVTTATTNFSVPATSHQSTKNSPPRIPFFNFAPAERSVPSTSHKSTNNPPPKLFFFNSIPTQQLFRNSNRRKSKGAKLRTAEITEKMSAILDNMIVKDREEGSTIMAPVSAVSQSTKNLPSQLSFSNVVFTQQPLPPDSDRLKRKGTESDGTDDVPAKKAPQPSTCSTFAYHGQLLDRRRVVPVVPQISPNTSAPHESTATVPQPASNTSLKNNLPFCDNETTSQLDNDDRTTDTSNTKKATTENAKESDSDVVFLHFFSPSTTVTNASVDDGPTVAATSTKVQVDEAGTKVTKTQPPLPILPAPSTTDAGVTPSADVLPVTDTPAPDVVDVVSNDKDLPSLEKQRSPDSNLVTKGSVTSSTDASVVVDTSKPLIPDDPTSNNAADQPQVPLPSTSVAHRDPSTVHPVKLTFITATLSACPPTCQLPSYGGVATHQLVNPSSSRLAFGVRAFNNYEFSVHPIFGFVEPGASATLQITRFPGPPMNRMLVVDFGIVAPDVTDAQAPFIAGSVCGQVVILLFFSLV